MLKRFYQFKGRKGIFFLMLLFLGAKGSLWASPDEWTMFKSDAAHSSVASADLLTGSSILKWSTGVIGSTNTVAYSSPVVLNGKTYIGSMSGTLFAFNAAATTATNSPLWSIKRGG